MGNKLYHFTDIDSLLKILISNKIRLSNIKNVNDVDEFSDLEVELKTDMNIYAYLDTLEKIKETTIKQLNMRDKEHRELTTQLSFRLNREGKISEDEWLGLLNEFKDIEYSYIRIGERLTLIEERIESIKQKKQHNKTMNIDIRNNLYLNCFTDLDSSADGIKQIIDKTTMWGHYADRHKGVCLILDKDKILELFKKQFEEQQGCMCKSKNIKYLSLADLNKVRETKIISQCLLEKLDIYFHKYSDWDVESEFRLLVYKETPESFLELCDIRKAIEGFIFGARTDNNNINLITEAIKCVGIDELGVKEKTFGFKASRYNYKCVQDEFIKQHPNFKLEEKKLASENLEQSIMNFYEKYNEKQYKDYNSIEEKKIKRILVERIK